MIQIKIFPEEEINYLKVINSLATKFNGFPNVPKSGTLLRPLVECTSAPTYKWAINFNKPYDIRQT